MRDKIIIELENMKFYAYHGHYEVEQKVGNHFLVSLQEIGRASCRERV